jgi:hypothetical protein
MLPYTVAPLNNEFIYTYLIPKQKWRHKISDAYRELMVKMGNLIKYVWFNYANLIWLQNNTHKEIKISNG